MEGVSLAGDETRDSLRLEGRLVSIEQRLAQAIELLERQGRQYQHHEAGTESASSIARSSSIHRRSSKMMPLMPVANGGVLRGLDDGTKLYACFLSHHKAATG